MAGINLGKSTMAGLLLIVGEKYIGNSDIGFDKVTISKFIESAGSDLLTDYIINNNFIQALKMSNLNSQLLTNSVVSGLVYLLIDYFAKMDNSSAMYKFLYQVGSSGIANFGYQPLINAVKMA